MSTNDKNGVTLMDVLLTLKDINEGDTNEDVDVVVVADWTVGSDGRLHIPKDKREKYDIEEGDDIDGILRVGGE